MAFMAIGRSLPHHFKSGNVQILKAKKYDFSCSFLLYCKQYNTLTQYFYQPCSYPTERIQKAELSVCHHHVLCHFTACSWDNGIYNQFASEQKGHGQKFEINAFWNEFLRQTAENWQSESQQLACRQVGF